MIDACNYKEAAQHTHRILHEGGEVEVDVELSCVDEVSWSIVQDLEQRLVCLIGAQCEQAQQANDLPLVIRTASLYPYLGPELWYNLEEQNLTMATQPQGAVVDYVSIMEGLLAWC